MAVVFPSREMTRLIKRGFSNSILRRLSISFSVFGISVMRGATFRSPDSDVALVIGGKLLTSLAATPLILRISSVILLFSPSVSLLRTPFSLTIPRAIISSYSANVLSASAFHALTSDVAGSIFFGLVSVFILGNCVMKARVKIIVRETINFGCPTENSTSENFGISERTDRAVVPGCEKGHDAGVVDRRGRIARSEPPAREILPEHPAPGPAHQEPPKRFTGIAGGSVASQKHRVLEAAEGQDMALIHEGFSDRQRALTGWGSGRADQDHEDRGHGVLLRRSVCDRSGQGFPRSPPAMMPGSPGSGRLCGIPAARGPAPPRPRRPVRFPSA